MLLVSFLCELLFLCVGIPSKCSLYIFHILIVLTETFKTFPQEILDTVSQGSWLQMIFFTTGNFNFFRILPQQCFSCAVGSFSYTCLPDKEGVGWGQREDALVFWAQSNHWQICQGRGSRMFLPELELEPPPFTTQQCILPSWFEIRGRGADILCIDNDNNNNEVFEHPFSNEPKVRKTIKQKEAEFQTRKTHTQHTQMSH